MVLTQTNMAVCMTGDRKIEMRDIGAPRMVDPNSGQPYQNGVILKVIASGVCGSDLHMYRGRAQVPNNFALGHEVFGEIVEVGPEVRMFKVGDWVSVPFNIACGICMNCKKGHTQACLNTNKDMPGGIYGYAMMGNWQGGQAQYMPVPFADFNLLKIDNKQKAVEHMMDIVLLSDVLPTGYNAAVQAEVCLGKTVYIAGAGPIGIATAASCFLLGASRVLVGDVNPTRLQPLMRMGCDVIDLSRHTDVRAAIRGILGTPFVDCGIDCVGFECHGCGGDHTEEKPTEVIKTLVDVVRFGGNIGMTGVYFNQDAKGQDSMSRQGVLPFPIGTAFMKGITVKSGQCPVMKYNADLLRCIMSDRLNLAKFLNMKIVDMKDLPTAYDMFSRGEPMKLVCDPNGMLRQLLQNTASTGQFTMFNPNQQQQGRGTQQEMHGGSGYPAGGMQSGPGGIMGGGATSMGSRQPMVEAQSGGTYAGMPQQANSVYNPNYGQGQPMQTGSSGQSQGQGQGQGSYGSGSAMGSGSRNM